MSYYYHVLSGVRWIVIVCFVLGAILTGAVQAADLKIAKVTLLDVYNKSVRIKNFTEEIQQLQIAHQAKETTLSGEIKKLRDQLQAGKGTLSKEQQDNLNLQIQAKDEELENERMTLRAEMSLRQQSLQNVVIPQIREVVAKIAKAEGYTLVITEQSVLYVSEAIPDITEKVAKALDEMPATEKQAIQRNK